MQDIKTIVFRSLTGMLGTALMAATAHAQVLTTESFSISSSGGSGGSGASTSDMTYQTKSASDGYGWAGGAGAVQGSAPTSGTNTDPANETFKFNIGSTVASLNATYGVGAWTIANATLSFASSNATQNNSRFDQGAGTFNIFYVANSNWSQSETVQADNPIYATTQTQLNTWAGSSSLLDAATYTNTIPGGGTGYVDLSYGLASTSTFVSDITSASASNDPNLSLYLMATDSSLGMIIFTGGQSQPLPTLSFQVVAVPEPQNYSLLMAGLGVIGMVVCRKRQG